MTNSSRWTRLNNHILEAALGLALLLVGLFEVLFPILGVTGPLPSIDTRRVHLHDSATQIPGTAATGKAALHGTHIADLTFTDPTLAERVLLTLPHLTGAVLLIVILELLLRMARTLADGDVFVPHNARRLAAIATAVLLIGTLVPLLDTITTSALASGTPAERAIETTYDLSVPWVLVALLVAATAAAFRQGTRLRAATEGLV